MRLKYIGLLYLLIGKTVSKVTEKGIIKSKSIIVDVVHTRLISNPLSLAEVLKECAEPHAHTPRYALLNEGQTG